MTAPNDPIANPAGRLAAGFESNPGGAPADDLLPTMEELGAEFLQFEFQSLLGRGGMGVVYRARHKLLDRQVALKVISDRVARQPEFAVRFQREAQTLAKLSHPNIVSVFECGVSGAGRSYLVMELVDGTNLREVLRTERMAPATALAIVPQLCAALQYAHDAGVVHRDIKPENILLDRQGRVKIVDFGLAKLQGAHELTDSHRAMGTPHYMAPEQYEKPLQVDHRADVYALGVVLYEMLTGEVPMGRFQPPSKKVDIDVRLDEVVLRALERDPSMRYQKVSELQTSVDSVTSSAPVAAGSSSEGEAKISKLALWTLPIQIAGLVQAAFLFVGMFTARVVPTGSESVAISPIWIFLLVVLPCIIVPWGFSMGVRALFQIRESQGRLYGAMLAGIGVVFVPTIILWVGSTLLVRSVAAQILANHLRQKVFSYHYSQVHELWIYMVVGCLFLSLAIAQLLVWSFRRFATRSSLPAPLLSTGVMATLSIGFLVFSFTSLDSLKKRVGDEAAAARQKQITNRPLMRGQPASPRWPVQISVELSTQKEPTLVPIIADIRKGTVLAEHRFSTTRGEELYKVSYDGFYPHPGGTGEDLYLLELDGTTRGTFGFTGGYPVTLVTVNLSGGGTGRIILQSRLKEEVECSDSFMSALDKRMQMVMDREQAGHAYKDKTDLISVYTDFLCNGAPLAPDVKKQVIDSFAKTHAGKAEYDWRINQLAAYHANAEKDFVDARRLYEAALAKYPETQYSDPGRHSKFQHLANDLAAVIWESESVEAAEDMIVKLAETDPRMDYVFFLWWVQTYESKGQIARWEGLRARLIAAYTARINAMPADAAFAKAMIAELEALAPVPE